MSMPGAWSYVPLGNRDWVFYANGKTVFSHPNALGSSVMQTDNTGAVVQDMLYYPWGQVWQWPQTGSGYHFAGLMYDTYDDKHVAPFRLLSPNLGRWLSPDPLAGDVSNPQSLNRYAYALDSPTTFIALETVPDTVPPGVANGDHLLTENAGDDTCATMSWRFVYA